MSHLVHDTTREASLDNRSVEELFNEAAKYGKVGIFSSRGTLHPNCYQCDIAFDTAKHTTMKAKSDFRLPLRDALIQAIEAAQQVVDLARSIQ